MRPCMCSVVIALSLASCASTPNWTNSHVIDAQERARLLASDDGYCVRASVGAVPMPEVRAYQDGPRSSYVSGSATTYNARSGTSTTHYNATVTQTPNVGESFASGYAAGTAIRQSIEARRDRDRVYKGCMADLGWVAQ